MAIKQFSKGSLKAFGNVSAINTGELARAALFQVDTDGTILSDDYLGIFLLNPTALEDSKSANWVEQTVPGQSDPLLQWVSSGSRTVSFEALVTSDTAYFIADKNAKASQAASPTQPNSTFITKVADVASKFFKASIPPPRVANPFFSNTLNLDISNNLNYYRSLLYPTYSGGSTPERLTSSPPLLVLMQGSSIARIAYGTKITNIHDVWVLTDLKIRVTKQLPNLAPMEAAVQFTLKQYNIRSFDRNRFR